MIRNKRQFLSNHVLNSKKTSQLCKYVLFEDFVEDVDVYTDLMKYMHNWYFYTYPLYLLVMKNIQINFGWNFENYTTISKRQWNFVDFKTIITSLSGLRFGWFVFLNWIFSRGEFKYPIFFYKCFSENIRMESDVHVSLFYSWDACMVHAKVSTCDSWDAWHISST